MEISLKSPAVSFCFKLSDEDQFFATHALQSAYPRFGVTGVADFNVAIFPDPDKIHGHLNRPPVVFFFCWGHEVAWGNFALCGRVYAPSDILAWPNRVVAKGGDVGGGNADNTRKISTGYPLPLYPVS